MTDAEALRQKLLAEILEPQDEFRARYKPGTFGCHEALHMACFLMESVDRELLSHGAVITNPAWFALANQAFASLHALYQAIGAAHVEAPHGEGDGQQD